MQLPAYTCKSQGAVYKNWLFLVVCKEKNLFQGGKRFKWKIVIVKEVSCEALWAWAGWEQFWLSLWSLQLFGLGGCLGVLLLSPLKFGKSLMTMIITLYPPDTLPSTASWQSVLGWCDEGACPRSGLCMRCIKTLNCQIRYANNTSKNPSMYLPRPASWEIFYFGGRGLKIIFKEGYKKLSPDLKWVLSSSILASHLD